MDNLQIMDVPNLTKLEGKLKRLLYTSEGSFNASQFAWSYHDSPDQIKAEIEEQEELIASLQTGPLAPGAGPRIYTDAYIAVLREALQLIEKANSQAG